ncbi:hypothetical protein ACFL6S_23270 [Candidatus Poribacteria bacterium]
MQEEREEHQEEESEIPEEDETTEESGDPSLDEDQPAEESEQVTPDEEESQPTDEDGDEDESVGEAEDDDLVEEEPAQRRGCLAGCITPIVVVLVIALVIIAIVYSKRDAIQQSLLRRIVVNTQDDVLRNLSADMDKNQIEKDFEKVRLALKEGRINEDALTEAVEEYQDVIGDRPSLEEKERAISQLMADLSVAIARDNE